jgi:TRAP transporter TAXI family solute receptor
MKLKKTKLAVMASGLFISLLVVLLCAPPAIPAEKIKMNLYCSRMGSSIYVLSVGLSEIVNRNSDRIELNPIETKSSTHGILEWYSLPEPKQKYAMGITSPPTMVLAKSAKKPFSRPWDKARILALCVNNPAPIVVRKDSNIKTGKDLFGKRISWGMRGAIMCQYYPLLAEEAWGLTPDKAKYTFLGFRRGAKALIDGTVDAAFQGGAAEAIPGRDWWSWYPNPGLEELASSQELRLISFPEETYSTVAKATGLPWYPVKVEAINVGKSDLNRAIVLNASNTWWVSKDLPDDIVNELLTIIYDHVDDFATYHSTGKFITKDSLSLTQFDKTEFHPAAIRFYEGKSNRFFSDLHPK